MKIAIITSHANSLLNFRSHLIEDLRRNGLDVFALAPDFNEEIKNKISSLGATPVDIRMNRTGMNPFEDLISTLQIYCKLKKLKIDIVFSYFIKPVIFGAVAAWLARVPLRYSMIEGLGFVFTESADNKGGRKRLCLKFIVKKLYKFSLSLTNKVIFLNPDDINEFSNQGIVDPRKTFLLGGIGVDLNTWRYSTPKIEPVTFLMVSRLLKEKGVGEYVAAAKLVKEKYPKCRFILLGGQDDNPGSISKEDVDAWVKEGCIEWHGHVPVAPWMQQSSVFVLPSSYREGVPLSTQEAMASGRAIITTDVPGCRETVIDGLNGYLIPAKDHVKLAEAMTRFIENTDLIFTMSLESHNMAKDKFDVKKKNKKLLSVILNK
jgi:glycosyltransferase involved in cell wall biosynthesis